MRILLMVIALLAVSAPGPAAAVAGAAATVPAHADDIRAIRARVVAWREAWEQRDVDGFVACFHPEYRSGAVDREALARQKRAIFARAQWIRVQMSDIVIEVDGAKATVRFVQDYRSDTHADRGRKTLILMRGPAAAAPDQEDRSWLIAGEAFESE